MITPGLVSITFRHLPAEEIVTLAGEAGLASIEWGGDVHVPHGDFVGARRVRRLTEAAGLQTSAYGSYFRADSASGLSFDSVLQTALELGAPAIRIWAGGVGSREMDSATRAGIIESIRNACDAAAAHQVGIYLEFHSGTLTDIPQSALACIADVARPNLTSYWQPPVGTSMLECLEGLQSLLPHVSHLHVFHWWPDEHHRLLLEEGADRWRDYFAAAKSDGISRHALLEFVKDGDISNFRRDAATLKTLLG